MLFFLSVGLTWTPAHRALLEQSQYPFELTMCELQIQIAFNTDQTNQRFPRMRNSSSYVADFGVLNKPNHKFQQEIISMEFDNVDFSWFAPPHTEKVGYNNVFIYQCNGIYIYNV